jgi:hypothetical protein
VLGKILKSLVVKYFPVNVSALKESSSTYVIYSTIVEKYIAGIRETGNWEIVEVLVDHTGRDSNHRFAEELKAALTHVVHSGMCSREILTLGFSYFFHLLPCFSFFGKNISFEMIKNSIDQVLIPSLSVCAVDLLLEYITSNINFLKKKIFESASNKSEKLKEQLILKVNVFGKNSYF